LLASVCLLGHAGQARAQVIWSGEIDQALRPGAYVPYNGASYFERYSYDPGAFVSISVPLYLNRHANRYAQYLDYLDRVDRARRFGRRPPPPPPWLPPSWVPPPEPCQAPCQAPHRVVAPGPVYYR